MLSYRFLKIYGHLHRWAVFLLLSAVLSSCSTTGSFDSISDAYSLAQKKFFSPEPKAVPPEAEDPVVTELRRKLEDSELEIEILSNDIKMLEREIQKKELAILLQGKVIKLLDDSNHTLQKDIEEQIAAQSFDHDSTAFLPEP